MSKNSSLHHIRPDQERLPAAVVVVGDELLNGRQDTNGPAIEAMLTEHGFEPSARLVLPDQEMAIVNGLRHLLADHALVIICGGLGPTQDDVTRQAAAQALGRQLEFAPIAWQAIQARFQQMRRPLPESNRAQAMIPDGAEILENEWGTAPGFWTPGGKSILAALPGPPKECLPMLEKKLLPKLQQHWKLSGPRLFRRTLRTAGMAESGLQEILGPGFLQPEMPELGFLLDEPGEILVILTARVSDPELATARLQAGYAHARKILAECYVGDGVYSLPEIVGGELAAHRQTLAVAESCTGGLVCRRITSVPGSSHYFLEGAVTYGNAAKTQRLGVPDALLEKSGAVSEAVAIAMAEGIRKQSRSDWGLSITGVAGPEGGTRLKPVGLVCLGLVGPGGEREAQTLHLLGDRDHIQRRSATAALDWLRRRLQAGTQSEEL